MRSLNNIFEEASRSLEFVAPLLGALLLQGSACTIEYPNKDKANPDSSAPATPSPGATSAIPSAGPSSQGTPSPGGSGPSGPQNPKPGTTTSSTPSGPTSSGEAGEEPEPVECLSGEIDNNCHALPDGTPIEFPTGVPLGNCKAGTRVCEDNVWGPCQGAIAPRAQDNCEVPNDDATCDGVANAGCDCLAGETRECGESKVGACKMGTQRCIDGKWDQACEGAIYPKDEACDGKGIDENCNGLADLADDACACLNDKTEYCERPKEKGDCKWGERTCKAGAWGTCEVWAKPQTEICGSRPDVEGVVWTGDENCDGNVDTSDLGKAGPKGCVDMMLDQDGDGYGKIGADLSKIKSKSALHLVGTACLCPNRPDIEDKRKEGWIEKTPRANRDCGDCPPPLDRAGREAFPGSRATTTVSNACLRSVGWTLGIGSRDPGDFDLDCNRNHEDPSNRGQLEPIRCRKSGDFSCTELGSGRLILPRNDGRLFCGRSYEFGRCYAIVEESFGASTRYDDTDTGDETTTDEPKPKKKFKRCAVRGTGRRHRIQCQ